MSKPNNKYNHYRIAVPTEYEKVITHFYFAENKSNEIITHQLIPSYQTILAFVFGRHLKLTNKEQIEVLFDKCIVFGPIKKSISYSLLPESSMLVANFKDDAFYRFFGTAIIEQSSPIHPDEFLSDNCFTVLWKHLSQLDNTQDRVDFILDFCKPYLRPQNKIAAQLTDFDHPTLNPIKVIADENNQTERNIQLNHKKYFGYSAKEINRYQRFLKAIQLIHEITSKNGNINWFDIIAECGYYDQSRLIHDFRYFLNLTPTKYLKLQESVCNPTS
ncbi:MAG: hypothetical protein DHS20C18_35690 [Saprospiraceae bacterium]|nr:MAG: hypothetical protein DHS20C18_35690 [Saprospiraceae bacterium]